MNQARASLSKANADPLTCVGPDLGSYRSHSRTCGDSELRQSEEATVLTPPQGWNQLLFTKAPHHQPPGARAAEGQRPSAKPREAGHVA